MVFIIINSSIPEAGEQHHAFKATRTKTIYMQQTLMPIKNSKSISNLVAHYIMKTHAQFCQSQIKTPLQVSRDKKSHFMSA